jgi:hypothetical protein
MLFKLCGCGCLIYYFYLTLTGIICMKPPTGQGYISELTRIFSRHCDRYTAHSLSLPVMQQMAADNNFLHAAIKWNFSDPRFLSAPRDFSKLLKLYIFRNKDFELVMNIFPPDPFGGKGTSVKSIHHHKNLLLTTVTLFGNGYETILFKPDFSVDKDKTVNLQMERMFVQPLHGHTFIDRLVPHVVFFPPELTVTLSLWCLHERRRIDLLRELPGADRLNKPVARLLHRLKLGGKLGLNDVSDVYFRIENGRFKVIDFKISYPSGTADDTAFNLLCFLKTINFDDAAYMRQVASDRRQDAGVRHLVQQFLQSPGSFSEFRNCHVFIKEENISKEDILAAVQAPVDVL